MKEWEELRKQARKLENDIDLKLVSFSKVGTGSTNTYQSSESSDTEPLLPTENVFDSLALEIEQLLSQLAAVNEKLSEIAVSERATGPSMLHTLQRHNDILKDYSLEFKKTHQNFVARRERENLLHSVKKDIDSYKNSTGLNRRMDMYVKENKLIRSSDHMIDDQITIAVETREHLVSQRLSMKRLQTRLHDVSSRFPMVNSLVQRIHLRKRRDSLILGLIIALLTFLLLFYTFH